MARRTPRLELICVGTELLSGKINTHAAWFSGKLPSLGLSLQRETSVGDDRRLLAGVLREALARSDVVLVTGGLGPTFDDLTREACADAVGAKLRHHKEILADIREKFRLRGQDMPPHNRRQAYVIDGAQVLPNSLGTAPGQRLDRGERMIFLLPGPPREMYPMAEQKVFPALAERFRLSPRAELTLRLFGKPESWVDARVRPLVGKRVNGVPLSWTILASQYVVDLRVAAGGAKGASALSVVERTLRRFFKDDIFGRGTDTLESVVVRRLIERKRSVSCAESCTGGLIAERLTRVPGASECFSRGFVTYANAAKASVLGVKTSTLNMRGAVSEMCAKEMAAGCRRVSRTDYALAVTGIAGPGGGTAEKPVGLVYLALASKRGVRCVERRFAGSRADVRERAALTALDMLRRELR